MTYLCVIRQSVKVKKHFCKYCLQCFSTERVLVEHKEICLRMNGKQPVKLRSGSIKFKNYFKQIAATSKIYADFECNVKRVKSSDRGDKGDNTSYTEKYQDYIPCSFVSNKLSNTCWLCNKLFGVADNKVRDHCHITKKYRVLLIGVVMFIMG